MNNLLNQGEGGNLGRLIVGSIPQIRRRPIVDDHNCDNPRRRTRPNPKAEPRPGDAVLTFFLNHFE